MPPGMRGQGAPEGAWKALEGEVHHRCGRCDAFNPRQRVLRIGRSIGIVKNARNDGQHGTSRCGA